MQLSSPELAIPLIRMIRLAQHEQGDEAPDGIGRLAAALETAKQRYQPAPAPTAPPAPAQTEAAGPVAPEPVEAPRARTAPTARRVRPAAVLLVTPGLLDHAASPSRTGGAARAARARRAAGRMPAGTAR